MAGRLPRFAAVPLALTVLAGCTSAAGGATRSARPRAPRGGRVDVPAADQRRPAPPPP